VSPQDDLRSMPKRSSNADGGFAARLLRVLRSPDDRWNFANKDVFFIPGSDKLADRQVSDDVEVSQVQQRKLQSF
jgi:hypothetical protein